MKNNHGPQAGDVVEVWSAWAKVAKVNVGRLLVVKPGLMVLEDDRGQEVVYNWEHVHSVRKATGYQEEAYVSRRKGKEHVGNESDATQSTD